MALKKFVSSQQGENETQLEPCDERPAGPEPEAQDPPEEPLRPEVLDLPHRLVGGRRCKYSLQRYIFVVLSSVFTTNYICKVPGAAFSLYDGHRPANDTPSALKEPESHSAAPISVTRLFEKKSPKSLKKIPNSK